jgi:hypothetical protein
MGAIPELKGSDKQIKWARTIRADYIEFGKVDEAVLKVNDASWWIANKNAVLMGTHKPPAPHQLVGGPPKPAGPYGPPRTTNPSTGRMNMRQTSYPVAQDQHERPSGQVFTEIARALTLFEQAKAKDSNLRFSLEWRGPEEGWCCWLVSSKDGQFELKCRGGGVTAREACASVVAHMEAYLA